jgi:hypothetical protein
MTISVSRSLNIFCIMFKIIAFFIMTLFARLYVRVDILLTCGKHVHDRIISLREEVWAYKTSLIQPPLIEVSVPNQEHGPSCICLLVISWAVMYLSVSDIMGRHVFVC